MAKRALASGLAAALLGLVLGAGSARAVDLRLMCNGGSSFCPGMIEMMKDFEAQNPDIRVKIDVVPYNTILQSLPVQLAAGQGPDLATVTDLAGLNRFYLDIGRYVDPAYYDRDYPTTNSWFRTGPDDKGTFGVMLELTVTGAFVNKTLFEQAGMPLPGPDASWDAWAAAAKKVAGATETPFAMAIDRSGHRIAGPAISYGARYFEPDGTPRIVDDGFRAFAQRFVAWNQDGTMAKDVWAGQGGAAYQDAAQDFINGQIVLYYSGTWQIGRLEEAIKDAFDWEAVGSPCGPVGCSGMPGGTGLVGFKQSPHPEAVAKVIDYFAREDSQARLQGIAHGLSANQALVERGIAYRDISPHGAAALDVFRRAVPKISPIAFTYQGYRNNRAMFNATTVRLTQAIVGESSLDDALARIDRDAADAIKAAGAP